MVIAIVRDLYWIKVTDKKVQGYYKSVSSGRLYSEIKDHHRGRGKKRNKKKNKKKNGKIKEYGCEGEGVRHCASILFDFQP